MKDTVGIMIPDEVDGRYMSLDNYRLSGKPIPPLFTVEMIGDEGITARPFLEADVFFTTFGINLFNTLVSFKTSKPAIYGNDLRLLLVGAFNNAEIPMIYMPDSEAQADVIYHFKDIYNNNESVYIPEKVILTASVAETGSETTYIVSCKTPAESSILKTAMDSAGIKYRRK